MKKIIILLALLLPVIGFGQIKHTQSDTTFTQTEVVNIYKGITRLEAKVKLLEVINDDLDSMVVLYYDTSVNYKKINESYEKIIAANDAKFRACEDSKVIAEKYYTTKIRTVRFKSFVIGFGTGAAIATGLLLLF